MLATLKILHLLALAVGIGGGAANALAGPIARKADPALAGAIAIRLGRASALALVVLWVTGIAMIKVSGTGLGTLGFWFWLKMLAAVALTALAAYMQVKALKPGPELAALGKKFGPLMLLCGVLTVTFAVIAFD